MYGLQSTAGSKFQENVGLGDVTVAPTAGDRLVAGTSSVSEQSGEQAARRIINTQKRNIFLNIWPSLNIAPLNSL
jgi:hypothetical protein